MRRRNTVGGRTVDVGPLRYRKRCSEPEADDHTPGSDDRVEKSLTSSYAACTATLRWHGRGAAACLAAAALVVAGTLEVRVDMLFASTIVQGSFGGAGNHLA